MNTTQNRFENNTATKQGGAIFYDYNRPVLQNNVYINNQALYGPNIASYPVKIVFNGSDTDYMSIVNVGSGIEIHNEFVLALVDYDNQVMVSNDQDLISINPLNFSESSILSNKHGQLMEGVTAFNKLLFRSQPGTSNVKFVASSNAIDSDKIQSVFGTQISDNYIDVSFRWCKPGEIYDNINSCVQ